MAPLASLDGKHVITIEGIGSTKRPHPTQERIARSNGSQCGFCTPGIVMSLYALLRNNAAPSTHEVEEAFDGNLCRCTGYRPILDAAQTFSVDAPNATAASKAGGGCCGKAGPDGGCCMDGKKDADGKDDQPIKRFTPPGFIEYNPDTELIFPPALKRHELRPLVFGNKRKKWYRPVTLDQLLQIKSVHPQAKVIGGSTETQIEIKFKALQYPVSVYVGDIAELRQYAMNDDHIEVGGNVVLTDLEAICERAVEHYGPQKSQIFAGMLKQLKFFAGRQIRNVGTPAGNLVTASPISDLNPVLWAAGAVLVTKAASAPGVPGAEPTETEIPMSSFFTGYRRTALAPDAVIASIRVPVTTDGEFFRAYKQAKRKDDDIAIVTAALRVRLDTEGLVTDSCLVYGGMAATTTTAKETMAYLTGRKFAELETLEGAMSALEKDFDMPFSVPGGMASYRKALAFGFFYRFYHDVLGVLDGRDSDGSSKSSSSGSDSGASADGASDTSSETLHEHADPQVVAEVEREISQGTLDHDTAKAYEREVTGKANPHLAALKQTTGEAQYTDDIPPLSNELHAAYVLSTRAHARILSVDYSAALAMPGVVDTIDKSDMPSEEANKFGAPHFDEVFLADGEVFTAGQPIAMVLATTPQRASEAARAVRVEYEDLPAILTIEDAVDKESFHPMYREIKNGNVEDAFATCDHVFTGTARMGGQEHFYLETNACVVVPKHEDGEMEIFTSTQNANEA